MISPSTKTIGTVIKNARLEKNYTQGYLGRVLNISQNAYCKIELGISRLTVGDLLMIADALDADVIILIKSMYDTDNGSKLKRA